MSNAWLIMYSDKAVNYMNNVVHARDYDDEYRAVIDHSKDIVAMSRNNSVLTRYKADNYIDLMILSRYLSAMYLCDGTMSMYKMVSIGRFLAIFPYGDALTAPYDALTTPGKPMSSGHDACFPSAGEASSSAGKVPSPFDRLSYPDGILPPCGGSVSPYRQVLSPPFGRSSPPGYAFPYPYDVILPYVDIVSTYADTLSPSVDVTSPSLDVVSAPYDVSWTYGDSLPWSDELSSPSAVMTLPSAVMVSTSAAIVLPSVDTSIRTFDKNGCSR